MHKRGRPSGPARRPDPARPIIVLATIANLALAALVGMVLVGGPITSFSVPRTGLLAGLLVPATLGLLFAKVATGDRWRLLQRLTVVGLPFVAVVIAVHLSEELSHQLVATGDWGWLLLAAYAAIQVGLIAQSAAIPRATEAALGGLSGIGGAVMVHVAAFPSPLPASWALVGLLAGAALTAFMMRLPPRPAHRTRYSIPYRVLPLSLAWIGAFLVAFPASPRHELASSAGVQILAVVLALGAAGAVGLLWHSERRGIDGLFAATVIPLKAIGPAVAVASLLALGGLQAASYSAVTADDLGRYWSVADSLRFFGAYPAWDVGSFAWMDLPILPLLITLSFQLLGHSYAAALAPIAVANLLLPVLIYGASMTWGAGRRVALAVAAIVVVAPPFQIHSLGSAEPDAIFIALLIGSMWLLGAGIRSPRRIHRGLILGLAIGALVLGRPEGLLYGASVAGVAVFVDRRRWSLMVLAAAFIVVTPFVLLSLDQLGRPWPTNRQELALSNLSTNLGLVAEVTWEKLARVVLLNDIRFPLLVGTAVAAFAIGSTVHIRRCWWVALLPIAVGVNVLVSFSVPADTVRTDELDEFVRHFAYPVPVFAVFTAAGLTEIGRRLSTNQRWTWIQRFLGPALAVWLIAGSLYVLATPEEFHHGARSGSLLTADIYVNAPELWGHNLELPCPPCLGEAWNFEAFRHGLFDNYRPFDVHSGSDGAAYQTLSGVVVAIGFLALLSSQFRSPTSGRSPVDNSRERSVADG